MRVHRKQNKDVINKEKQGTEGRGGKRKIRSWILYRHRRKGSMSIIFSRGVVTVMVVVVVVVVVLVVEVKVVMVEMHIRGMAVMLVVVVKAVVRRIVVVGPTAVAMVVMVAVLV